MIALKYGMYCEDTMSDARGKTANDTDILIIMMLNIQKFSQSYVCLDMGLDDNNSHTFINVKGTADKLNYIQALPLLGAITVLHSSEKVNTVQLK